MNISNIEVGMRFSTKAKLINTLGLKKVTNKEDIEYQDRKIARYLIYEKTGKINRGKVTNEIVIKQIFDEPKPKIDLRCNNKGGNNNKYTELIDALLLHTLSINGDYMSNTLKTIFTTDIKVLNEKYIDIANSNYKFLAKKYQCNEFTVQQYMYRVRSFYTDIFKASLQRLEKRGLLEWTRDYMVVEPYSSEKQSASELDSKLPDMIRVIEEKVLADMGITRRDLMNDENYENFHEQCVAEISTDNKIIDIADIFNYWNCYTVVATQDIDEYQLQDDKVKELTCKLTERIIVALHKSLENSSSTNQRTGKVYHPFVTEKVKQFILTIEQEIFNYDFNNLIEDDLTEFGWTSIKLSTAKSEDWEQVYDNTIAQKEYEYDESNLPF